MEFTLFYAWQSDSPPDENRYLIRDAAKEALKRIDSDGEVEESPRLDHDTKGLSGTPEVASSIFAKIDRAGMFVADVTFVGTSTSHDGREKKLPNMNAAIELGYAGKALGWERVILVMNTTYGSPDDQVFDIKHRRNPLTYCLPANSKREIRNEICQDLSRGIEIAIKARLKCEHEEAKYAAELLDENCLGVFVACSHLQFFPGPLLSNSQQNAQAMSISNAISRLLELRLLRCDMQFHQETKKWNYAYHWTYLGKLVGRHLGIINVTD